MKSLFKIVLFFGLVAGIAAMLPGSVLILADSKLNLFPWFSCHFGPPMMVMALSNTLIVFKMLYLDHIHHVCP